MGSDASRALWPLPFITDKDRAAPGCSLVLNSPVQFASRYSLSASHELLSLEDGSLAPLTKYCCQNHPVRSGTSPGYRGPGQNADESADELRSRPRFRPLGAARHQAPDESQHIGSRRAWTLEGCLWTVPYAPKTFVQALPAGLRRYQIERALRWRGHFRWNCEHQVLPAFRSRRQRW